MMTHNHKFAARQNRKEADYKFNRYKKEMDVLQKSLLSQQWLEHLWHSKKATKLSKNKFQHVEDNPTKEFKTHKERFDWIQIPMASRLLLEMSHQSGGILGEAIHPFRLSKYSAKGHHDGFSLFKFLFFLTAFFSMVGKVESRSDDHGQNSTVVSTHTNFSYLSTLRILNESHDLSSLSPVSLENVSAPHTQKLSKHDGISQNTRRLMNDASELPIMDWNELFRKQETGILQYLTMIRPMGAIRPAVYQYAEPAIWPAAGDLLRAAQQDRVRFMEYFSQWLGRSKVSKKSLMSSIEQRFFDQTVDKIFNLCLLNMDKANPEEVDQFKKRVTLSVMSDLVHYLVHRFPKNFSVEEFRRLESEKKSNIPRYSS